MLDHFTRSRLLDRAAILLSGLCAVHCIASVLVIAFLASSGSIFFSHSVHEIGLALAIVLGIGALGYGFYTHGALLPLCLGVVGLGFMATALAQAHSEQEIALTMAGVAILALGHMLNGKAHRNSSE